MLQKNILLLFVFISFAASAQKIKKEDKPILANLHQHIEYLASDGLEGRRTGTAGEKLAAEYISGAFAAMGLQPKGSNGFYQSFDVAEGREISAESFLSINGTPLQTGTDFYPLNYSPNATIEAMPSLALLEKGEPWFFDLAEVMKANKANTHFDVNDAIIARVKEVEKGGGKALFVYNTSALQDGLQFNGKEKVELLSIPVIYIGASAAKKYFSDPSASLRINSKIVVVEKSRSGNNVVGFIDNGATNTIVIGAHFDHLGYGEDHNSRFTGSEKQIHNGADDNASGTAALIELARMVKASKLKASNYLFIAFSGEELGLYGSKYFTQHPTVDLNTINFMINMDMVGRLSDSSKIITVGGYGTSPAWGELYSRKGKKALYEAGGYRFDSSGTGPSDHTSFYLKNIPVLFYFTGLHPDYHKPSDDFDKINYTGELAIVKHIYSLLQAAGKMPEKFAFTKTRETQTGTTARFSVTLGIMPDYTFNGAGVRIDGISDNRPAQKAGLQTGDVIMAVGEYKTGSMESYMQTLGKFKKGDKTTITYSRGKTTNTVPVEF